MTKAREYNEKNFLEFLGTEQTNLHISLHNLRTEFNIFTHVDYLYQGVIRRAKVPDDEVVVMQLFLLCHFHLYHSASTMLRCHLADAMASARKAIDGCLTARRIIDDPKSQKQYIDGHGSFKSIVKTYRDQIKKGRCEDKGKFIQALISLHGKYSEVGSHADLTGFAYRAEWGSAESDEAKLHYFQMPRTISEFSWYFLALSKTFLLMLHLFEDYFVDLKQFVSAPWKTEVLRIGADIDNRMRKLKTDHGDEWA